MLDLIIQKIIQNKEWLFSGIAVAVPLAVIGWLGSKRKSEADKTSTYSVQQTHNGSGDNVVGNKNIKE